MNRLISLVCMVVLTVHVGYADVQLEQLKPDDLSLLNVAVKARLLEKLSEETDKLQFERNELVYRNKACLLNVSAAASECKLCVADKCEKRAKECQLSNDDLQKIKDNFQSKSIPGVDFISSPTVVQEEIREIKETSETEIMADVPQELKPKGQAILVKVKQGMVTFHDQLNNVIQKTLPEMLPKIEQNIDDIGSRIDMDSVQDIANQAADQISEVISDPALSGIRENVAHGNRMLQDNLPSIVEAMGNTLTKLKSAVGRFVGVVRVQAGTAWKQATSNQTQQTTNSRVFVFQGQQIPQNQIPNRVNPVMPNNLVNNQQLQFPNNNINMQGPQPYPPPQMQPIMNNVVPQNGFLNTQQIQMQNLPQAAMAGRIKRQADVSCDALRNKLNEACHSYHFYCSSCMNERTILEHDCGRGALVAMVAIKELDLQTGNDLVKYKQFVNKGQIVKKILYDKKSYNKDIGTYSRAYVSVHIGGENKEFGTSILPNVQNLKHAGFVLADELWSILKNNNSSMSTGIHIESKPEFHTARAEPVKSEQPKSSAAVTGALWGVMGTILYLGLTAILVMV